MKALANALGGLRARLAARPDTEHEQAIVRLVLGALIVLYLLPDALRNRPEPTLLVMVMYLAVAALLFMRILAAPGVSHTRRVLAAVADVSTITWCMAFLDERAAPLFLLYVWITLANGFRFGPRYLVVCPAAERGRLLGGAAWQATSGRHTSAWAPG